MASFGLVQLLAVVLLVAPALFSQTESVFAGAIPSLTRGGGLAVDTALGRVSAIAISASGTAYFVDASQDLIMTVSPNGFLSVIGGNGKDSSWFVPPPEGSPALDSPVSAFMIAVDNVGNVFLSDYAGIREITTDGVLHSVLEGSERLPSGTNGPWGGFFSGLTIDAKGRIFFSESPGSRVWRLDPDSTLTQIAGNGTYGPPTGDGGLATQAVLGEPHGLAVDIAGNVYIADDQWGLIRKVSAADGTISTIAGGGNTTDYDWPAAAASSVLTVPQSLAFDQQGNLDIFYEFNQLARISPDGTISQIPCGAHGQYGFGGDGGLASVAQFQGSNAFLAQFALDNAGSIYFPDGGNGRIRKIDTAGIVTTFAGNGNYQFGGDGGPASLALFNAPNYISFGPAGDLYVSDNGNHRVRRIAPNGTIETVAGTGETYIDGTRPPDGTRALNSPLAYWLYAATGAPGGGFYFAESYFIRKVDSGGSVSVAVGAGFPNVNFTLDGDPATDLFLSSPQALVIGPDGRLYFSDNTAIRRVNENGTYTTLLAQFPESSSGGSATNPAFSSPRGFSFGYSTSTANPSSKPAFSDASRPHSQQNSIEALSRPPIKVPRSPETREAASPIYFADVANGFIRELNTNGVVTIIAGNGAVGFSGDGGPAVDATLFYPGYLVVDKGGYIYIADWGNNRVRRVSPDGTITTIATDLSYPSSLALDSEGTLYVADEGNNRIVSVTNPQQ